jgi:hypothetical protein
MVDMGLDTKTTTYELGNAGLDLTLIFYEKKVYNNLSS